MANIGNRVAIERTVCNLSGLGSGDSTFIEIRVMPTAANQGS
jgi:hypothetical protein